MIDHRSYEHDLTSCEIKAWKNIQMHRLRPHFLTFGYY